MSQGDVEAATFDPVVFTEARWPSWPLVLWVHEFKELDADVTSRQVRDAHLLQVGSVDCQKVSKPEASWQSNILPRPPLSITSWPGVGFTLLFGRNLVKPRCFMYHSTAASRSGTDMPR
jgi:hypothetical protein